MLFVVIFSPVSPVAPCKVSSKLYGEGGGGATRCDVQSKVLCCEIVHTLYLLLPFYKALDEEFYISEHFPS